MPRRAAAPTVVEPDPPATCRVYVIELDPAVLRDRRFRAENPRYAPGKLCFYVGSTALTPEERFANHRRGHKGNRYAGQFGRRLSMNACTPSSALSSIMLQAIVRPASS